MFTKDELQEQLNQQLYAVRAAGPRPDTQSFDYLFNEVIKLRGQIREGVRSFVNINKETEYQQRFISTEEWETFKEAYAGRDRVGYIETVEIVRAQKERTMEPNTPSKPPIALTPFTRIYNALSLMNSMIICGEQHSPVSITLYEEAMRELAALESNLSQGGIDPKGGLR